MTRDHVMVFMCGVTLGRVSVNCSLGTGFCLTQPLDIWPLSVPLFCKKEIRILCEKACCDLHTNSQAHMHAHVIIRLLQGSELQDSAEIPLALFPRCFLLCGAFWHGWGQRYCSPGQWDCGKQSGVESFWNKVSPCLPHGLWIIIGYYRSKP